MIRLLCWLAVIALVGGACAWVADHPGSVTMHWSGYRIDTSVAFLLGVAALAVFVAAYMYLLARAIITAPVHFSRRRQLSHYQKGLSELTYSVAALAASDSTAAEAHVRKAEKLIGHTPITLLLSAQVARLHGDDEKTQRLLTEMLQHKETEYLAARSLCDVSNKQQLFSQAIPLAQRARSVSPREKQPATTLIGLHIRLREWQQAMHSATLAAKSGALLRSEKKRYLGIIALKQGQEALDSGQLDLASACAKPALSYLGRFAPAIVFAARCKLAAGQHSKATSFIMQHWKTTAHPELGALFRMAIAKEAETTQLKLAEKLCAQLPENPESQLALAEIAIKHKAWSAARKALRAALSKQESMRACKLMAYVEQGEYHDVDAANRWLSRSAEAHPDAAWTCADCGDRGDTWNTHCSHCGAFDTYAWKDQAPLVYVGA